MNRMKAPRYHLNVWNDFQVCLDCHRSGRHLRSWWFPGGHFGLVLGLGGMIDDTSSLFYVLSPEFYVKRYNSSHPNPRLHHQDRVRSKVQDHVPSVLRAHWWVSWLMSAWVVALTWVACGSSFWLKSFFRSYNILVQRPRSSKSRDFYLDNGCDGSSRWCSKSSRLLRKVAMENIKLGQRTLLGGCLGWREAPQCVFSVSSFRNRS